jgi:hypothetical protein
MQHFRAFCLKYIKTTRSRKDMSQKDKEVQKRYKQEQTRYKKQVEKIQKLSKKQAA